MINERYERGSILLTSNRAPAEWADLFLDRLLDRAEVIIIRGASYHTQGRNRVLEEVSATNDKP